MAIVFDSIGEGVPGTGTSLTVSQTVTGPNNELIAFAYSDGDTVTGVTFNSVAMTKIGASVKNSLNNIYLTAWHLEAPATGTHNLVVSASGSVALDIVGLSYTGANQSGQPDASATSATGTPQNYSNSVTPVLDNCWAVCAFIRSGAGITGFSAGTARTANHGTTGLGVADLGPVTPPASTTITATSGGTGSGWASIIVSIKPLQFDPSTSAGYTPIFPAVMLDTTVEMVDSGFNPRAPQDPFDPTPS